MTQNATLQTFTDLLHIPSPSGREHALAKLVVEKIGELGFDAEQDASGNVLVRFAGRDTAKPLQILASHIDELGMVVSTIRADGTLKVKRSGGLYPFKLGEGPVTIMGDAGNITGVLSMGSMHRADAGSLAMTWDDVWVLTGVSAEKLTTLGVRVGTMITVDNSRRGPFIFGDEADPLVGAWTFDDRLGAACLLQLLQTIKDRDVEPLAPTIIAFTVSEEIGGLGAKSLCFREKPEIFIAVDGSPMPPETDLSLDGRGAIWAKDRLSHYDYDLQLEFLAAAKAAGTEMQTASYDSAASDASLVAYAGLAPRIACVGHVRENSHGFEVIRLSVIDNVVRTITQYVLGQ